MALHRKNRIASFGLQGECHCSLFSVPVCIFLEPAQKATDLSHSQDKQPPWQPQACENQAHFCVGFIITEVRYCGEH